MIKSEGKLEKYFQYIATELVSLMSKELAKARNQKRKTSRKMSRGNGTRSFQKRK